jgi:hypothetical protein
MTDASHHTNRRASLLAELFPAERAQGLILHYLIHWQEHGEGWWDDSALKIQVRVSDQAMRDELATFCGQLLAETVFDIAIKRWPQLKYRLTEDGLLFGDSSKPPQGGFSVEVDIDALRRIKERAMPDSPN